MEVSPLDSAIEVEEDKNMELDIQDVPKETKEFRALLNQFQNDQQKFTEGILLNRNLAEQIGLASLSKEEFKKIYKDAMNEEIVINDQTRLAFYLSNSNSNALFTKVQFMIVPIINEITVCSALHPQPSQSLGMIYGINICDLFPKPFQKE